MPQTLLALLAMMIAMMLSLNVQRQVIRTQHETIANELEVMATGIALQTMETIRARAFDEEVVQEPNKIHDKSAFESPSFANDGDGNACAVFEAGTDVCDDLDDFEGLQTVMEFEMGDGVSMPFNVEVDVHYVNANLNQISSKTYQKEVTVYVQDVASPGRTPFIQQPIYLSRVFAYNFNADGLGHTGGQGTNQGQDETQSGQFMDWFMEQLLNEDYGEEFEDWVVYRINEMDWKHEDKLIEYIEDHNRDKIEQWMNKIEPARSTILEWWGNYNDD